MKKKQGLKTSAHKGKLPSCQEALILLYDSLARALPYLESCFRMSKVGSPDWFQIPQRIKEIYAALEAGRNFVAPPTEFRRTRRELIEDVEILEQRLRADAEEAQKRLRADDEKAKKRLEEKRVRK